jgi:MFS transporter, DHA2 family, multidrug resistance protein
MGGLQIMLDKGEENDWFSSGFICFFAVLSSSASSVSSCGSGGRKNPLINLRSSAFKNFAICCFLMMLVGGVLNANTVLQPQFTQQLLGLHATTAGLALTAGGVTLVFMMPLAGFATGKVSARYLAAFGFTMLVITFRYAADVTNLQMSFAEASWLRVVQMLPLPFCFISITTAAYVGMPREQSNQVAGLINFVRNIGGSILIAITNAQVTSRAMWHEQHLQQAMQPGTIAFDQHRQALTGFLGNSFGGPTAAAWRWPRSTTSSTSRRRRRATRMSTWSFPGPRSFWSRWPSCSARTANPKPTPKCSMQETAPSAMATLATASPNTMDIVTVEDWTNPKHACQ